MGRFKFKKRLERVRHRTIHKIWEHGNYYGPGWSGGKHQQSIDYTEVPGAPLPVDAVDEAAMQHDAEYARARKRGRSPSADVDFRFAKRAFKTGTVRGVLGGLAVGAQGVVRSIRSKVYPDDIFTRRIPASPPPDQTNNLIEMSGRIGMRFRYPSLKIPKSQKSLKGIQTSKEYNGYSDGVHTCSLGVGAFPRHDQSNIDSPWYALSLSIFKMIMRKHYQVDVQNTTQLISHLIPNLFQTQVNVADDMPRLGVIRLYALDDKAANPNQIYALGAVNMYGGAGPVHTLTRTVHDVAVDIAGLLRGLSATFRNATTNANAYHHRSLYGYALEEIVAMDEDSTVATAGSTRMLSTIHRLDDKIVRLEYFTTIKIQNTTVGTNGYSVGVTTTDALESNPIVGKIYHWKGPKPIMSNVITESGVGTSGSLTITGNTVVDRSIFNADTDLNGIYKVNNNATYSGNHIPTPQAFKNVNKWAPCSLRPGEIKVLKLRWKFDGYINKLLYGLAIDVDNTYNYVSDMNGSFGVGVLFCFEEYLGASASSGSSDIRIHYEVNRFVKCQVKKSVRRGTELVRDYAAPVTDISLN